MSESKRRRRAVAVAAVLMLLVGAAAALWLGRVRELPDFQGAPGETVEVELAGVGLVGRWPKAMGGPWQHGWEVREHDGIVVVQPRCAPPGEFCSTRYPRPALTLGPEGTVAKPKNPRRLVGPGDRRLVYDVLKQEGFRECSSTLVGRLTVGARTLDVACGYTTEEGCGGGGAWCLPYLRHLREASGTEVESRAR